MLLIIIWLIFIFIGSIILNIILWQNNRNLHTIKEIEKNSYKNMMDSEVAQKRIYYNLSEKLIYENRELKQREKVLLMKNSRLFRLIRNKNDKKL